MMVCVLSRYREHLFIGSRVTRDAIAERNENQSNLPKVYHKIKPFPPAYCHYTNVIGDRSISTCQCNLSYHAKYIETHSQAAAINH
jgi:hypothetical protein